MAIEGADGAGDETRTRDIQLGRLALYQLSYSRSANLREYRDGPSAQRSECCRPSAS
jgi:hypothetical protein